MESAKKLGIANINSVEKTWKAVIFPVASTNRRNNQRKARNSTKNLLQTEPRITIIITTFGQTKKKSSDNGTSKVRSIPILFSHIKFSQFLDRATTKQNSREKKKI